jgi:hypothetical protein
MSIEFFTRLPLHGETLHRPATRATAATGSAQNRCGVGVCRG